MQFDPMCRNRAAEFRKAAGTINAFVMHAAALDRMFGVFAFQQDRNIEPWMVMQRAIVIAV